MASEKIRQARRAGKTIVALAAFLFLATMEEAAQAHDHGRARPRLVVHWQMLVGDPWFSPYPYHPWPAPLWVPVAPIVVAPPVYIERSETSAAATPFSPGYWYYCASKGGYYPQVPNCEEEWVPVPPRQPDKEDVR